MFQKKIHNPTTEWFCVIFPGGGGYGHFLELQMWLALCFLRTMCIKAWPLSTIGCILFTCGDRLLHQESNMPLFISTYIFSWLFPKLEEFVETSRHSIFGDNFLYSHWVLCLIIWWHCREKKTMLTTVEVWTVKSGDSLFICNIPVCLCLLALKWFHHVWIFWKIWL